MVFEIFLENNDIKLGPFIKENLTNIQSGGEYSDDLVKQYNASNTIIKKFLKKRLNSKNTKQISVGGGIIDLHFDDGKNQKMTDGELMEKLQKMSNNEILTLVGGSIFNIFGRKPNFDKLIEKYDKVIGKTKTRLGSFESVAADTKSLSKSKYKHLTMLFQITKARIIIDRIKNDPELTEQRKKRAEREISKLVGKERNINKRLLSIQKTFNKKLKKRIRGLFGSRIFSSPNVEEKINYILNRDIKQFNKLQKDYDKFANLITEIELMKNSYVISQKTKDQKFFKQQRKDIEKYTKNQEKYEKILAFDKANKFDDIEKLQDLKENLADKFQEYMRIFGELETTKDKAITNLDEYKTKLEQTFTFLNNFLVTINTLTSTMKTVKSNLGRIGNFIKRFQASGREADLAGSKDNFNILLGVFSAAYLYAKSSLVFLKILKDNVSQIKNAFVQLVIPLDIYENIHYIGVAFQIVIQNIDQTRALFGRLTAMLPSGYIISGGGNQLMIGGGDPVNYLETDTFNVVSLTVKPNKTFKDEFCEESGSRDAVSGSGEEKGEGAAAEAEAEAEAKAKSEAEAKAKAEEEAKAKEEEEAKAKEEEKAKEAEAKKAAEEARLKAEEEARLKAEEEARLKAEAARLKAEEAKKTAEAAKAKADAEKVAEKAEAAKKDADVAPKGNGGKGGEKAANTKAAEAIKPTRNKLSADAATFILGATEHARPENAKDENPKLSSNWSNALTTIDKKKKNIDEKFKKINNALKKPISIIIPISGRKEGKNKEQMNDKYREFLEKRDSDDLKHLLPIYPEKGKIGSNIGKGEVAKDWVDNPKDYYEILKYLDGKLCELTKENKENKVKSMTSSEINKIDEVDRANYVLLSNNASVPPNFTPLIINISPKQSGGADKEDCHQNLVELLSNKNSFMTDIKKDIKDYENNGNQFYDFICLQDAKEFKTDILINELKYLSKQENDNNVILFNKDKYKKIESGGDNVCQVALFKVKENISGKKTNYLYNRVVVFNVHKDDSINDIDALKTKLQNTFNNNLTNRTIDKYRTKIIIAGNLGKKMVGEIIKEKKDKATISIQLKNDSDKYIEFNVNIKIKGQFPNTGIHTGTTPINYGNTKFRTHDIILSNDLPYDNKQLKDGTDQFKIISDHIPIYATFGFNQPVAAFYNTDLEIEKADQTVLKAYLEKLKAKTDKFDPSRTEYTDKSELKKLAEEYSNNIKGKKDLDTLIKFLNDLIQKLKNNYEKKLFTAFSKVAKQINTKTSIYNSILTGGGSKNINFTALLDDQRGGATLPLFYEVVNLYLDAFFDVIGISGSSTPPGSPGPVVADPRSGSADGTPSLITFPVPGGSSIAVPAFGSRPNPGNPSGSNKINEEHLEKLQIKELKAQLEKLKLEEVTPGFTLLEQLSDNMAYIKDIEHFETLGKPPKPSENIFETLGLNREEGYKIKKVGSKTIEANKDTLKKEIQKNPQLTAKIKETLSVNEDNILAKMNNYFRKVIEFGLLFKSNYYLQPEERELRIELSKWLQSMDNQNKLLNKLKTNDNYKSPVNLYLILKDIKIILGAYSVSREITDEIKLLNSTPEVKEYIERGKKKTKKDKDKDKDKDEDKDKDKE